MNKDDFEQFSEYFMATCLMCKGEKPSELVLTLSFNDLDEYPLKYVKRALEIYRKSNTFTPAVSQIIEIIKDNLGLSHISAEEAWGKAVDSFDEFKTVVWTKEIAQAAAIAAPLYNVKYPFDARKAFTEAYKRIISTTHTPPIWVECLGFDSKERVKAIENAVVLKRLPENKLKSLQIEHKPAEISFLQLIDMSSSKTDKNDAKAKISGLKTAIFTKGKGDFDTELAILRKNGKKTVADEFEQVAQGLTEDELSRLVRRLKAENLRCDAQKAKQEMLAKAKTRMTPEEIAEFDSYLTKPRESIAV